MRNAGLNDTFNLQRFLCPLAPSLGPKPQIVISGPRNWWDGALDVEGLALSSVSCFGRALASFLPKGCSNQLKIDSSRIAGSFSSLANLRINDKKTVGLSLSYLGSSLCRMDGLGYMQTILTTGMHYSPPWARGGWKVSRRPFRR